MPLLEMLFSALTQAVLAPNEKGVLRRALMLLEAGILVVLGWFLFFIHQLGYEADPPTQTLVGTIIPLFLFFVADLLIIAALRDTYARSIRIVGVRRPENARKSIDLLRQNGYLFSERCPLTGVNWTNIDLHEVDLSEAYLRRIGLESANLRKCNLECTDLRSARLDNADLREANLHGACLRYARLSHADLGNAQLDESDLSAADLSYTRLEGASIRNCQLDRFTVLPDGKLWTPQTDLSRFGATE